MPIDVAALAITDRGGAVRFEVRAKPRAPRTRIVGVREGALVVALAAAPLDGEANVELTHMFSSCFGVPTRDVVVVAGQSGRRKIVEVRGIDLRAARGRLGELAVGKDRRR